MSEYQAKPKPLWIVHDKNDNPWGPFETTFAAKDFLIRMAGPGNPSGWSIVALRHPNE